MIIGMPVAYAMGLSALIGAWWIELPYDAVMIAIAGGVNKFSLLAIPFFVLAGAIMAEGGMSRRLVAFAEVLVGFVRGGLVAGQHSGLYLLRRHLRFLHGRHRLHWLGTDPGDGKERLPA
ncbi:TRAP transporter large permease subunit [Rhodoferax sp.]|uniref:TRAP transporter large permease subunit n=1 Tax=Rhodoferax sp. TaxID=50421 RepID=UPI002ACEDD81|nr:TRAP transporter large permease subunit [Rhodoferax sp.]MDZ7919874.1 TRAP transporter large permease subunit [Rhodoferax sp.]